MQQSVKVERELPCVPQRSIMDLKGSQQFHMFSSPGLRKQHIGFFRCKLLQMGTDVPEDVEIDGTKIHHRYISANSKD
jgi:hypothetical protein